MKGIEDDARAAYLCVPFRGSIPVGRCQVRPVRQYDYSGTSSWTVFRYLPDGEREEFFNLFARYEVVYDGDTSPVPYYEIDGVEVDQTTFEAQLEERITGQMLERSEWMTLNSNSCL